MKTLKLRSHSPPGLGYEIGLLDLVSDTERKNVSQSQVQTSEIGLLNNSTEIMVLLVNVGPGNEFCLQPHAASAICGLQIVTFVLVSVTSALSGLFRESCCCCGRTKRPSCKHALFPLSPSLPHVPRIRDDPSQPPLWVFASGEATQVNGILHSGQRMPRVGTFISPGTFEPFTGINSFPLLPQIPRAFALLFFGVVAQ